MGNFLQQLQNNEAVLLMYLADELPSEDRTEVEQLLANDAGLRRELAQLKDAQSAVTASLYDLDASSPLPVAAGVAMRQVSRIMKQRQLDKLVVEPHMAAKRQWNIPWWAYWTASAAASIVVLVVWWGMKSDLPVLPQLPGSDQNEEAQRDTPLDSSQQEQANLLRVTMMTAEDTGQIAQAENEANILVTRRGEDEQPLLSVFGTSDQTQ
jgi:hypothetical protein